MIDDARLIDGHDEPDDIAEVADALIAERGGASNFSVAQIAAARRLAMALCSEQPTGSNLAALLEMLPPRESGAPADLTRLSDKEFEFLDFALAKARGEDVVSPRREKKRGKQSARRIEAVRLVELLDRVQATGRVQLSHLERNEVKNLLVAIVYPFEPIYRLFAQSIASLEQPSPTSSPSAPPAEAEAEAPAEQPANVVKLKKRIW